jgi:hypothetical protein
MKWNGILIPVPNLTPRPRPPIRHCPVCGIAMVASKPLENMANFDRFECLTCHTLVSEGRPPSDDGPAD